MQLLAIILYSLWGDRRTVRLRSGRLNVITGQSKTGKSSLIDIVEFCLGRSTVSMAVGPVTDTVSWYAVLLELPSGVRAFVARPAPRAGAASTQQAMLEVAADLEPLEFAELQVNADTGSLRSQLGTLIGIEENRAAAHPGSTREGLEANIGHATLLCLQGQSEIANRNQLFHRQGEEGITGAIQDTLPYFLGAVPAGQALKRQILDAHRRDLRRLESELSAAEKVAEELDTALRTAVAEAYAVGLVTQSVYPDRSSALSALTAAVRADQAEAPFDDVAVARTRELDEQRSVLRRRLREISEIRTILLDEGREEGVYQDAVTSQVERLSSVDLLPIDGDPMTCPVCGSRLAEPDPTATELRNAVLEVRGQLNELEAGRPKRQAALAELDEQIANIRDQLRALERAAADLALSLAPQTDTRAQAQAFSRGRLDVLLQAIRLPDASALAQLRSRVMGTRLAIERLEAELNPDDERDQVASRLNAIGADMTEWAVRLHLEHSGRAVRLDLRRLTVVADTESGPALMSRIGSAENWIGYHLIAHLALHRFFVRQKRPVPRLLMLDQPTQAYYPSELDQISGVPSRDEDRLAVRRLYELMREVVQQLVPEFQVIVCDHANLDETWFQEAIVENWRLGAQPIPQLVPATWIERLAEERARP